MKLNRVKKILSAVLPLVSFITGAYNMGGSPKPTVARIKKMVYMNHTVEQEAQSREEYLGELLFKTSSHTHAILSVTFVDI